MPKRKAEESPSQNEGDETNFDDNTLGDAIVFLRGVDDDDFLGILLSANDEEHGGPNMAQRAHKEGGVDVVDRGAGGTESQFCAERSTRVFADDSTPLVDPLAQNCEAKPPARALYPPSRNTDSQAFFPQVVRHSQLLNNPILPRDISGTRKMRPQYQPVEKKKRGPYFERRESWTTTNGRQSGRLSGTISTTQRNNPLPLFEERVVPVSVLEDNQDEEEQER
eukprot:scaffold2353_cov167-Amphora_coffeaeformis.AAC.79